MNRDSSGSIIMSGEAARRLGISGERLRQLHRSGIFRADRITYEGVGLYLAERVEDFRRKREGYAEAAPRLKVAWQQAPVRQYELQIPLQNSKPEEWVVE